MCIPSSNQPNKQTNRKKMAKLINRRQSFWLSHWQFGLVCLLRCMMCLWVVVVVVVVMAIVVVAYWFQYNQGPHNHNNHIWLAIIENFFFFLRITSTLVHVNRNFFSSFHITSSSMSTMEKNGWPLNRIGFIT